MARQLISWGSSFEAQIGVRVHYILPAASEFECRPVLRKYFGEVRPAATMPD